MSGRRFGALPGGDLLGKKASKLAEELTEVRDRYAEAQAEVLRLSASASRADSPIAVARKADTEAKAAAARAGKPDPGTPEQDQHAAALEAAKDRRHALGLAVTAVSADLDEALLADVDGLRSRSTARATDALTRLESAWAAVEQAHNEWRSAEGARMWVERVANPEHPQPHLVPASDQLHIGRTEHLATVADVGHALTQPARDALSPPEPRRISDPAGNRPFGMSEANYQMLGAQRATADADAA